MHPVIAESILDRPVSRDEVYRLYEAVTACWSEQFGNLEEPDCRERMFESEDEDFIRSSELVLDIFFKASFSVDDQWIPFIVLAAELVKKNYSFAKNRVKRLLEILEHAKQIPDEIRIRGYVVCLDIMETFIPVLEKEIEKQQVCRTVSDDAYNLARCYRATGDTQKELEYLQKAYPVFARIYADRNEKTHLARERIEELTQKE